MSTPSDILEQLYNLLHYPIFIIGKSEFSTWSLLKLIVAIIILSWLSKRIRNVLVHRVLIRYNDDIGVRQAMGTIARYLFLILGLLVVIHASGIDLSGLALLGGALGVGIGFGLQSITNNFVSGIV